MPSKYTQADRQIAIYTPLGDDVLLLKGLTMTEEIGRPFVCQCDLRSEDESAKHPHQNWLRRNQSYIGAARLSHGNPN